MAVPRASLQNETPERGFDRMLDAASARVPEWDEPRAARADAPAAAEQPAPEHAARARTVRAHEDREAPATESPRHAATPLEAGTQAIAVREPARGNETAFEGGETTRRIENDASKGVASPASLLQEERIRSTPTRAAQAPAFGPVPQGPAASPAAPRNTGTPVVEKAAGTPRAAASTATAPTYRTVSKQAFELAEQARDSVFKQIAMHLTPERGEVRMRLEPPDLGQLDLKLVVDDAGRLSLSMLAEKAGLAQMLEKHMPELERSLAQCGLALAQASVQQQDAGDRHGFGAEREAAPARPAGALAADRGDGLGEAGWSAHELARQGFFTAQGFDFWV